MSSYAYFLLIVVYIAPCPSTIHFENFRAVRGDINLSFMALELRYEENEMQCFH